MNNFIGICSLCGGNVTIPIQWVRMHPPSPMCNSCGATAKNKHPVVEMEKKNFGNRNENVLPFRNPTLLNE